MAVQLGRDRAAVLAGQASQAIAAGRRLVKDPGLADRGQVAESMDAYAAEQAMRELMTSEPAGGDYGTGVLQVGEVSIGYRVRFSARAGRRRIEVTAGGVEVIVPGGSSLAGARAYAEGRRRWVYDAMREVERAGGGGEAQVWASGAKLMYRGRYLRLDIGVGEVDAVTVSCRSRFWVRVPEACRGDTGVVREAVHRWLRERAQAEAERYVRRYGGKLGVMPAGVRVSSRKWAWGTCGRDGVVRIHWELIQAPAPVMEYVAAHEVAHLLERNHSPRFWRLLDRVMPDWEARKAALERWEGSDRRRV